MTTHTPSLLPLASPGCGCCAPASPSAPDSHPDGARAGVTPGVASVYEVTGMTCGHCAGSVTKAVSALPQVEDVRIDLAAGGVSTVTVTGVASPEEVRQAIEEAGYTVLP